MNAIRSAALAGVVQILLVWAAVSSCVNPLPPTPVPTPVEYPDAAVDIFTGATIDCAEVIPNPPVDDVRTCADVTNTDTCMADLVSGTRTKDTVGCTARDLGMELHVRINKGIASDASKAQADAIDRWFRDHKISVRN